MWLALSRAGVCSLSRDSHTIFIPTCDITHPTVSLAAIIYVPTRCSNCHAYKQVRGSHSRGQGVLLVARFAHHFYPHMRYHTPHGLPCSNFDETAVRSILMSVVAGATASFTTDPIVWNLTGNIYFSGNQFCQNCNTAAETNVY